MLQKLSPDFMTQVCEMGEAGSSGVCEGRASGAGALVPAWGAGVVGAELGDAGAGGVGPNSGDTGVVPGLVVAGGVGPNSGDTGMVPGLVVAGAVVAGFVVGSLLVGGGPGGLVLGGVPGGCLPGAARGGAGAEVDGSGAGVDGGEVDGSEVEGGETGRNTGAPLGPLPLPLFETPGTEVVVGGELTLGAAPALLIALTLAAEAMLAAPMTPMLPRTRPCNGWGKSLTANRLPHSQPVACVTAAKAPTASR